MLLLPPSHRRPRAPYSRPIKQQVLSEEPSDRWCSPFPLASFLCVKCPLLSSAHLIVPPFSSEVTSVRRLLFTWQFALGPTALGSLVYNGWLVCFTYYAYSQKAETTFDLFCLSCIWYSGWCLMGGQWLQRAEKGTAITGNGYGISIQKPWGTTVSYLRSWCLNRG